MATTMRCVAPQARIGGRVSIKAPSQTKAFGLSIPKNRRSASKFQAMAYKITLKTPSGEEEIECDGESCYALDHKTLKKFLERPCSSRRLLQYDAFLFLEHSSICWGCVCKLFHEKDGVPALPALYTGPSITRIVTVLLPFLAQRALAS